MRNETFWVGMTACMLGFGLLMALGVALSGCATANTVATIEQVDADGASESVEFRSTGMVSWGSKQELQRGDLDYTWGDVEHFQAGGRATNQESSDPMTAIMGEVIKTLLDRMMPIPALPVIEPEER